MIAELSGILIYKSTQAVVVDVHGVGYEVAVSLPTVASLPALGDPVRLYVTTHVREDALLLFGFLSREEKQLFLLLQEVSGIGPKLGLSILSGMPMPKLIQAIRRGDAAELAGIPGVGKKTSARLALELKEKVQMLSVSVGAPDQTATRNGDDVLGDAVSALVNLGYKAQQADEAVRRVAKSGGPDGDLETLVRESLRILSR